MAWATSDFLVVVQFRFYWFLSLRRKNNFGLLLFIIIIDNKYKCNLFGRSIVKLQEVSIHFYFFSHQIFVLHNSPSKKKVCSVGDAFYLLRGIYLIDQKVIMIGFFFCDILF